MSEERTLSDLCPDDVPAVRSLIEAGLTERWGRYDGAHNPDVTYLWETYRGSVFLVGKYQGQVVACGALIPETAGTGRIVRMYVAALHRRSGWGSALLHGLLQRAAEEGYTRLVLETTSTWSSAIAFYQKHGFTLVENTPEDCHFQLDLS